MTRCRTGAMLTTMPTGHAGGSSGARGGRADNARSGGDRRTGDYPRGAQSALPASGAPPRPHPRLDAQPGAERAFLARLISEYRRERAEHGQLPPREDRQSRHLEQRMAAAETTFEHLLSEWTTEGDERDAWRAAFHGHAPSPQGIEAPTSRLVFRGRTAEGVELEACQRDDARYELRLDGKLAERLVDPLRLTVDADGWTQIADVCAQETFDAPHDARLALATWTRRGGSPPWQHAFPLLADGLIDERFALTPRGRRALALD
jgi:hypothetical protein